MRKEINPKLSFTDFEGNTYTVDFGNWDVNCDQMMQALLGIMVAATWNEKQVLQNMHDFSEERLGVWYPEMEEEDKQ